MSDIEIEIDGKLCQAKPNAMIIEVADREGIYIPRFCYHKALSIAANCRMCLVEVEKAPKTLPACATPVAPGMKVFTRSAKALASQKAVMEFLLINHPLDCPICDQGGECELQDLSMGYGASDSLYTEGKRSVKDKDIGPLIATDMTRCIQCTRCVRFGAEVAGMRELGATGRGEDMEIGTYIDHAMKSEISGNVIDLCPVGALTSKPFRFTARAWELNQRPTISPHDCLGSNIYAHTRNGKVMRVVPRENHQINTTWISDRDRFSYEGLYHKDRVDKPYIKEDGTWQEVSWHEALEFAVKGLQSVLTHPENLGTLAAPNSTVEEFYLLQKLVRGLGSFNLDHRLLETDFSDQNNLSAFPGLPFSLNELEDADAILLIGSNIQKEQPMVASRVRKAALRGATVMAVNPIDYRFHFDLTDKQIVAPDEMAHVLAAIVNAVKNIASHTTEITAMAEKCQLAKKFYILLGGIAEHHPEAALLRSLAQQIANLNETAKVGRLTDGANAAGAWLAGVIPHRDAAGFVFTEPGLNAKTMWEDPRKAYLLLNVEPDLDCAAPPVAVSALRQAEFIVSLSTYRNPIIDETANVILPVVPFTETSGTWVNAMGMWQSFHGVAEAFAEARPAWKVLRVLGNVLHLDGFDYESSEEVLQELQGILKHREVSEQKGLYTEWVPATFKAKESKGLVRIGEIPLYAVDGVVRRAKALQEIQPVLEGELIAVRIHPAQGVNLQLVEGEMVIVKQQHHQVHLPVMFDERLPLRGVYLAGGIFASSTLSELFGPVELEKL